MRAMNGRQLGSLLERIRNLHIEHGHLGRRYASVIQEFNPAYQYGRAQRWQLHEEYLLTSQ